MKHTIYGILAFALLLSGCLQDEAPIPKREPGDVESAMVAMGVDYDNQLYYDLETGLVVTQNIKTDWDLAFGNSLEDHFIYLNGSRAMFAGQTDSDDFSETPDPAAVDLRADVPSGNSDSTAFRHLINIGQRVGVVDLGRDLSGTPVGQFKMQVIEHDLTGWRIRVGELADPVGNEVTVSHGLASRNFRFFQYASREVLDIEPPQNDWDLWFTQYMERLPFNGDTLDFLVTGVLINPYNVGVAEDDLAEFDDITRDYAERLDYETFRNAIGYDWKRYDFDLGHIVNPLKVYVIRDTEGAYYKLRFIDFYNDDGDKGHPLFEYQRL